MVKVEKKMFVPGHWVLLNNLNEEILTLLIIARYYFAHKQKGNSKR
jgi:hypothetical protein